MNVAVQTTKSAAKPAKPDGRQTPPPAKAVFTDNGGIVFKDLEIRFTTSFVQTWADHGSGAHDNGATWIPVPATNAPDKDFLPMGDLFMPNYSDPNGIFTGMMVKSLTPPGQKPAVAPAEGYVYIWKSAIYMLKAPDGYVAMGGIGASGGQYRPASDYACIRADLVVQALPGGEYYNDHGSGYSEDVDCWAIMPPDANEGEFCFSPSTFVARSYYGDPGPMGFYAFKMPLPETPPADPLNPPVLTSRNPPPPTINSVQTAVHLPWFAVSDPGLTPAQQMAQSPFYSLIRTDQYQLATFKNNATSEVQNVSFAWTEGVSQEQVQTFSHTVGVELGFEWKLASTFTLTGKLSYSFTYSTESHQGMMSQQTVTDTLNVAPQTAMACYYVTSTYNVYRQDGTLIPTPAPVYGVPNSSIDVQYPPLPEKTAAEASQRTKPAMPKGA